MTPDLGLANWFLQRSLRTPERLALRFEGATWTYGQMQRCIENSTALETAASRSSYDKGINSHNFWTRK